MPADNEPQTLNCYKLLAGQFIGPDYTAAPVPIIKDDVPVIDKKTGKPLTKLPSKKWVTGETVVSPHDLVNRPAKQFTFAGPYTPKGGSPTVPTPTVPPSATPTVPTKDEFYSEAELNEMTVADLKAVAAEEEIDLGSAHLKADIVKALLAAKS